MEGMGGSPLRYRLYPANNTLSGILKIFILNMIHTRILLINSLALLGILAAYLYVSLGLCKLQLQLAVDGGF